MFYNAWTLIYGVKSYQHLVYAPNGPNQTVRINAVNKEWGYDCVQALPGKQAQLLFSTFSLDKTTSLNETPSNSFDAWACLYG